MATTETLAIDATDNLSASQAALRNMQRMLCEGTAIIAQNTSGGSITLPAVVKLVNRATVDDHIVPTIAKALAADFGDLCGMATMDENGGTSVANNDLCFVQIGGHVKINTGIGAGSLVWVDPSTSGAITATPNTGQPPVGKVIVTGASGILLFNPRGISRDAQFTQTFVRAFVFTNATHNRLILNGPFSNCKITQVTLLSDTATTGSGAGTRWDFQVRNITASLNLLSAAKTTNGAEIAANTFYDLTPNQNQTIAANDAIRLEITKTGSPTDLSAADVICIVEYQPV